MKYIQKQQSFIIVLHLVNVTEKNPFSAKSLSCHGTLKSETWFTDKT